VVSFVLDYLGTQISANGPHESGYMESGIDGVGFHG
jgi:hypothetical protein